MIGSRDVTLKEDRPRELLLERHEKYLKHYANDDMGTEQIMGEFLKMSGMYWGLNALYLMKSLNENSPEVPKTLEFIMQCQNTDGGFAAAPKHDSHILHTLSAIQMLVTLNKCRPEFIDINASVQYISSMQQHDGSFFGDKWGEVDTRFTMCAMAALKLLDRLDAINLDKAVEFVMSCSNQIDGGFSRMPGSESHTAYCYCCVGSLAIADKLHLIDVDSLSWWLSERQLPSGGLNGRPEKLPDLCYSWWCLASMKMLNRMDMIDHKRLLKFILACQDEEQGGFSDRPGNWVDPFHTNFGLASISLICHYYHDIREGRIGDSGKLTGHTTDLLNDEKFQKLLDDLRSKLKQVNPVLCMPEECLGNVM